MLYKMYVQLDIHDGKKVVSKYYNIVYSSKLPWFLFKPKAIGFIKDYFKRLRIQPIERIVGVKILKHSTEHDYLGLESVVPVRNPNELNKGLKKVNKSKAKKNTSVKEQPKKVVKKKATKKKSGGKK